MTQTFCHPEFGCGCEDVIGGLELELAEALEAVAKLQAEAKIREVFAPKNAHSACGSTCTDECMRMTV